MPISLFSDPLKTVTNILKKLLKRYSHAEVPLLERLLSMTDKKIITVGETAFSLMMHELEKFLRSLAEKNLIESIHVMPLKYEILGLFDLMDNITRNPKDPYIWESAFVDFTMIFDPNLIKYFQDSLSEKYKIVFSRLDRSICILPQEEWVFRTIMLILGVPKSINVPNFGLLRPTDNKLIWEELLALGWISSSEIIAPEPDDLKNFVAVLSKFTSVAEKTITNVRGRDLYCIKKLHQQLLKEISNIRRLYNI